MQRYELDAWLGDAATELTDEDIEQLLRDANAIEERYPDPDDADDQQTAITTVLRLSTEDHETVLNELADKLYAARRADHDARVALRQAALSLIHHGGKGIYSEQGFAQVAGVTRMSVREWIGKRER